MSARRNHQLGLGPMEVKPVGPCTPAEDKSLVQLRADLTAAIDESGWKREALAHAMSEKCGRKIDGPYLSKLESGEKPLAAAHLDALPNDVEAIFYGKRAERMGLIVATPAEDTQDATEKVVSGLTYLLGRRIAS